MKECKGGAGKFVIPNLGRAVKAHRKARMGRNPQTGEADQDQGEDRRASARGQGVQGRGTGQLDARPLQRIGCDSAAEASAAVSRLPREDVLCEPPAFVVCQSHGTGGASVPMPDPRSPLALRSPRGWHNGPSAAAMPTDAHDLPACSPICTN